MDSLADNILAMMLLHHIGIATDDIEGSIKIYRELGFTDNGMVVDEQQRVKIAFLRKPGHPDLELIAPIDKSSPVYNLVKKCGVTPYHFCYQTEDGTAAGNALKAKGFFQIRNPTTAVAIDGRQVSFWYHPHYGLIEIIHGKAEANVPKPC